VLYRTGVGDRSRRSPPRSTDHMRMASTSKAFNGAVVLALVDRGTLSLDDAIAQRLPNLPAGWGPVTLRQLLAHTSGLPDFSSSHGYTVALRVTLAWSSCRTTRCCRARTRRRLGQTEHQVALPDRPTSVTLAPREPWQPAYVNTGQGAAREAQHSLSLSRRQRASRYLLARCLLRTTSVRLARVAADPCLAGES
jgi:CubicO group peptidase (beta-lactamase class C family)